MSECSDNTGRTLIEKFLNMFQEIPYKHVSLRAAEPLPELSTQALADIKSNVAGKPVTLLIVTKTAVYPRDVRQVLWQFEASNHEQSANIQYLLVAESISPGAKELLRAKRVGYYDSSGNLFLPIPGAYIYIDKPPPKRLKRSVRSLFSGRRAQVLHALLLNHEDWFGVTAVAARAQVAPSTVLEVLGELAQFDWLASRGRGPNKERHLREPGALLDAWAKQLATLRAPTLHRYYAPGLKADALTHPLGEIFKAHQIDYALSNEVAAQRYAPFLSSISRVCVRLLPDASTEAAIAELGARLVDEGANLVVIEAKSAGELLFRQQIDGIWLSSPIQVYLDLLRSEGRAKEMAEHLRRERIGF
jgi:hypothetical protein